LIFEDLFETLRVRACPIVGDDMLLDQKTEEHDP